MGSRDGPCSMISLLSFLSLLVSALSSSDTASLLSTEITEEQEDYSDWYYLKLVSADEQDFNVSNDEDNTLMIGDCQEGELYQQIVDNICSKLSVQPSPFSVFSLDTLSTGVISLNVSLVWPPPLLHLHLSEMPVYSPVFYLCSRLYTLALLLHDRDYLHQEVSETLPDVEIFTKTLLLLTFLTVLITVTILLIMFAVIKSKPEKSE